MPKAKAKAKAMPRCQYVFSMLSGWTFHLTLENKAYIPNSIVPIRIYTVCCTALSVSIWFVAPPYPNLYGLLHRPIRIYPVSTISEVKVQLEKSASLVDCRDMCGSKMLFSFSQATLSIFVSYLRRTPLSYVR